MKVFYKLFKQDPESRDSIITMTSGLGIVVNLLLASIKIVIGLISGSIAIASEGANNAADVLSSVLTLIGTKIAGKHPDKEHPFGYRRIEYLTGLIVAVLVLVTGIQMLIDSAKLIIHPEEMNVSYLMIGLIALFAVVKFVLGVYTIKMGKKADSAALEGVGVDCRGDSFASLVTIAATLIFLIFHISLDGIAGVIISLLIIKAGYEILSDTLSELIGRAGEKELAAKLYKEIRGTEGIVAAVDMMLHNYGPDAWSGSVNVEVDHNMSVGEIYQILHKLQLHIMHEYAVTMVFGIYAVDNDNPKLKEMRKVIGSFIREYEGVNSYHALYIEPDTNQLYCDFIVSYDLTDWDALRASFESYMKEKYPQYELNLVIETEFV
ncbi:MAG: cation transporter [Lachnospiraceae bacterium]|nr:cation transporter [Candidatus Equihabitans merdae]